MLLALCGTALSRPARADDGLVERPGYALSFDPGTWRETGAAMPSEVVLECHAGCAAGTRLLAVRQARPLPRPGAGAFTPGAAGAASVAVIAQAMTPGGRLLATTRARPVQAGQLGAYAQSFEIEDKSLDRSSLALIVVPLGPDAIHWRLTAPGSVAGLEEMLIKLLAGFRAVPR
jgi:hypothetical protein